MGFFHVEKKAAVTSLHGVSIETLRRGGCSICPLNKVHNRHPKMEPTGSDNPLIYILGGAPGENEDKRGEQFVGRTGEILRGRLPKGIQGSVRFNNCVRTKPPDSRAPALVEIECCRPSIVRDIETARPKAIFGLGNVALNWAIGQNGISKWNGRRVPIKVGDHTCWFYPMHHPIDVNASRKFTPRSSDEYGSETEFVFAVDLKRALAELDDLPEPVVHTEAMAHENVEIITGARGGRDVDRVLEHLHSCYARPSVGLDYETDGKRPFREDSMILTIAVANSECSLAWAMYHKEAEWNKAQLDALEKGYEDFLYEAKCRKVSHNLAFEMEWTAYFYGRDSLRAGPWDCSMSEGFILDERTDKGAWGCLSLEFLCIQHFGLNIKKLSNINRKRVADEPLRPVLTYNAIDAKYHRFLHLTQTKELRRQELLTVYDEHLRRIPTMVLTQLKGLPIDQTVVNKLHDRYSARLNAAERKIHDLPVIKKFRAQKGEVFSPSSNQDIAYVFRKMLHIPLEGTDEKILAEVDHPLAKLIVEWRKPAKILSTYIKPVMPDSEHIFKGRAHPIISTCKTRTWRTSSEDPNIQNWPKRNEEAKEVRTQVKDETKVVVAFDYAGMQARNVAMESKDKALVQAFWDRYDIHGAWTKTIIELYPKWAPKGMLDDEKQFRSFRNRTKNEFVFPSLFGAQPRSLSGYLGIPEEVTTELSEMLFKQFSSVKKWHELMKAQYYELGYVQGLSGFRRRAPISPNQLINAPIQADESIIVCTAMNELSEMGDPRFQASMEIHDDLTFIWPKKDVEKNAETVIDVMVNSPFKWINVPLQVEMAVGADWGSTKEVGVYATDTWKKVQKDDPPWN